ncbi:Phospholipase A1 PLIP2, chloroplastic-like protein [Drosera capensis]
METLRFRAPIPWITTPTTPPIINPPLNPSTQLTASSSRSHTGSISVEKGGREERALRFPFNLGLRSVFGKQRINGVALDDAILENKVEKTNLEMGCDEEEEDVNWVMKILHVRSIWAERKGNGEMGSRGISDSEKAAKEAEGCDYEGNGSVCKDCEFGGDAEKIEIDREVFSRLLKKVSLAEVKLYAQLSYLGNLAYSIPSIKSAYLMKRYGLRYVTSSIEKRELARASSQKEDSSSNAETDKLSGESESAEISPVERVEFKDEKHEGRQISAAAAFQITASAASYLYTRTRSILAFGSSSDEIDQGKMASFRATTESVTAVVAAEEDVKQAFADDLNSINSSPCEWFICDDDKSATRFFVIQGSETVASWQANLLFEPVLFERLDVFVHRGIYEAAKGMYQQMLPEVRAHMTSRGSRAKFRFTGHSLGGSLSLLLNLMFLIRGEVPSSSLLPVITFGAPCIMCGGDDLLHKLGLPKSHVQSITMHRDIVPRAFSCTYPNHVAELLKAVNGNFRNHPCLQSQKLLYAPMGEFLILQPDAKFSPPHDLLPSGSGLYLLRSTVEETKEIEKQLRGAKKVFLNTPHPLEILSDRSAYGNGGMIQRDHDMNSYLKCVRGVIRQELSRIRKAKKEQKRKFWWPILVPHVIDTGVTVGSNYADQGLFSVEVIVRTGSESLKWLSRFVASQRLHLLLVFMLPARLLLVGAFRMIA